MGMPDASPRHLQAARSDCAGCDGDAGGKTSIGPFIEKNFSPEFKALKRCYLCQTSIKVVLRASFATKTTGKQLKARKQS